MPLCRISSIQLNNNSVWFVQTIGSCLFLVLIYKQPSLKLRIIDLRNLIVLIFLSFGTSFYLFTNCIVQAMFGMFWLYKDRVYIPITHQILLRLKKKRYQVL